MLARMPTVTPDRGYLHVGTLELDLRRAAVNK
jgi:hypothetical protein